MPYNSSCTFNMTGAWPYLEQLMAADRITAANIYIKLMQRPLQE